MQFQWTVDDTPQQELIVKSYKNNYTNLSSGNYDTVGLPVDLDDIMDRVFVISMKETKTNWIAFN